MSRFPAGIVGRGAYLEEDPHHGCFFPMTTPPVACTLTPGEMHCQASELLPGLAARAASGEWTEIGMELRFMPTSANLVAVTKAIDRERDCCAFLTFRLEVPAAQGEFVLAVSGPIGTRDFLSELGLTFPTR